VLHTHHPQRSLLVVGVAEDDLTARHVAQVHAAAAIIGQAAEVRSRVQILLVGLEADCVLVELGVAPSIASRSMPTGVVDL